MSTSISLMSSDFSFNVKKQASIHSKVVGLIENVLETIKKLHDDDLLLMADFRLLTNERTEVLKIYQ